jgi:hypothetical protein
MNPTTILGYCDQIDALTQAIRDELTVVPPDDGVLIEAGGDLQAALEIGGPVSLAVDASFSAGGGYRFTTPTTLLAGLGGNTVDGDTAPALVIPPEIDNVVVETLVVTSASGAAFQMGRNDSEQTTRDRVPTGLRLRAVTGTGHRGKRVFEINGSEVEILDCEVHDGYATSGQDSQAIWIGNSPGPELVSGGYFAHEGSSFCDLCDDKIPIDKLWIVGSTWNYGSYGIRIGGVSHGDNTAGLIRSVLITGNTITGAHSSFKTRYPDNVYLDPMSQAREHEVDAHAHQYAREILKEIARVHGWESEYR